MRPSSDAEKARLATAGQTLRRDFTRHGGSRVAAWGPRSVFGLNVPSGSNAEWRGSEGETSLNRVEQHRAWHPRERQCRGGPVSCGEINAKRREIGEHAGGSAGAHLTFACGSQTPPSNRAHGDAASGGNPSSGETWAAPL